MHFISFSLSLILSLCKMLTGTQKYVESENCNSTTVMHAMTICITYSLYSVSLNYIPTRKKNYLYSDLVVFFSLFLSVSLCMCKKYFALHTSHQLNTLHTEQFLHISQNHAKIIHFVGPLFEFIIRYVFLNQQIEMVMKLLSVFILNSNKYCSIISYAIVYNEMRILIENSYVQIMPRSVAVTSIF